MANPIQISYINQAGQTVYITVTGKSSFFSTKVDLTYTTQIVGNTTTSSTTKAPSTTTSTTKALTTTTTLAPSTTTSTTKAATTSTTTKAPSTTSTTTVASGDRKNIIWSSNFEKEPVTAGFNSYIQQPKAGAVTLSSDVAHSGTKSAKFYLSKADADANAQWRAEMTLIGVSGVDPIREGDEFWYGMSYFLPSSYVSTNEEFITQWHHNSGTGSPPCALMTQGGNFVWDYITSNGGNDKYINLGAYQTNKWTDVVYHFKWSSTSSGLTEVWIDGVKKLTLNGPNLFSGMSNYMKVGIYKWVYKNSGNSTTSRTIYIDDFRIGNKLATYNDVKP